MEQEFKSGLLQLFNLIDNDEVKNLKETFENKDLSANSINVLLKDFVKNKDQLKDSFLFKKLNLDDKDLDNEQVKEQLSKLIETGEVTKGLDELLKGDFDFSNIESFLEKDFNFDLILENQMVKNLMLKYLPASFDKSMIKGFLEKGLEEIKKSDMFKNILKKLKEEEVQNKIKSLMEKGKLVMVNFMNELGIKGLDDLSSVNPDVIKRVINGKEKNLMSLRGEIDDLINTFGIDKDELTKTLKKSLFSSDSISSNPIISKLLNGALKQFGLGGKPKKNVSKEEAKYKRRRRKRSEFRKQKREELKMKKKNKVQKD